MSATIERNSDGSYTVTFNNTVAVRTVVSSSTADVLDWIENIAPGDRGSVVGIAVRHRFARPSSPRALALLQLCVDRECLLFQVLHAGSIPSALYDLFLYGDRRFVGVGMMEIEDELWRDHGVMMGNTVDLGELVAERTGQANLRWAPIQVVAQEVIGMNVNIWNTVTHWEDNPLSRTRITRACADAFLAAEIGRRLLT